ncbi:hypothetical protein L1887_28880 [Cichorium endivia]|nr:hypothetical protein L1887_28880 [Cichorium endivia]
MDMSSCKYENFFVSNAAMISFIALFNTSLFNNQEGEQRSYWLEVYIMFRHVYGRRSERQRKKTLSRFSNTINEPVIVQEDDQNGQDNVEPQQHDVDEQTQHENDILNTEIEDGLVEEISPSTTKSGKRKLKKQNACME